MSGRLPLRTRESSYLHIVCKGCKVSMMAGLNLLVMERLMQISKAVGATVIAVCRGAAKAEALRRLGADEVHRSVSRQLTLTRPDQGVPSAHLKHNARSQTTFAVWLGKRRCLTFSAAKLAKS